MTKRRPALAAALVVTAWGALAPAQSAAAAVLMPAAAAAQDPVPPAITAEAGCLVDVASGRVLYDKGSGRRLPPASTAKILTALVVLERGRLDERITVSPAAAAAEGSSMYLRPGMTLTAEDLLYGLLLESGNDAALALAEGVAGSVEAFAGLMNERARAAGAGGSRFLNPSGLPAAGQYTTACDLALIARAALRNQAFARMVATRSRTVTLPGGEARRLINHNWLLGEKGIDGVKTGYTTEAAHTYVASATRDGWRLVAAVLRDTKEGKWRDARDLLDFGFAAYRPVRLLEDGRPPVSVPVAGGRAGAVPLVAGPVTVPLRADGTESAYVRVEAPRQLHPPVRLGQRVGRLRVMVNSHPLNAVPLRAAREVAPEGSAAPRPRGEARRGLLDTLAAALGWLWHTLDGR